MSDPPRRSPQPPPPHPPPRDLEPIRTRRSYVNPTPSAFGELTDSQRELVGQHDSLVKGQRDLLQSNHSLHDRLDLQDEHIEVNKKAINAMAEVVDTLRRDVESNTKITSSIKGDTEGLITLIRDAKGAGRIISTVSSILIKIGIPGASIAGIVAAITKWILPH